MTARPERDPGYLNALYRSLVSDSRVVRDDDPLIALGRIASEAISTLPPGARSDALLPLQALADVAAASGVSAAIESAQGRFESPEAFAEVVYLARCLARDASALDVFSGRAYAFAADVPDSAADLRTDRQAVLSLCTFATLWREPARAEWMVTTLGIWQREYVGQYAPAHARRQSELLQTAERLEDIEAEAEALRRLNGLRRLGAPLGAAALSTHGRLSRLHACPLDERALVEALALRPVCPGCGYRMTDPDPAVEATRAARAVRRGFAGQQSRLAREVSARIIAAPRADANGRIDEFIRIVQASDLAALALVLDDALVRFIDEMLAAPAPPDVLGQLAAAFPDVTADNTDACIDELRRLLGEALAAGTTVRLRPVR